MLDLLTIHFNQKRERHCIEKFLQGKDVPIYKVLEILFGDDLDGFGKVGHIHLGDLLELICDVTSRHNDTKLNPTDEDFSIMLTEYKLTLDALSVDKKRALELLEVLEKEPQSVTVYNIYDILFHNRSILQSYDVGFSLLRSLVRLTSWSDSNDLNERLRDLIQSSI